MRNAFYTVPKHQFDKELSVFHINFKKGAYVTCNLMMMQTVFLGCGILGQFPENLLQKSIFIERFILQGRILIKLHFISFVS